MSPWKVAPLLLAVLGAACDPPAAPACKPGSVLLPGGGVPDGGGHVHPDIPVPAAYQNVTNPYGYNDPTPARLGQPIFAAQCARCHGEDGRGCGPEASSHSPLPDDLWQANNLHTDPYLFWRIHDGGNLPQYGLLTAMPAFKDTLDDDRIWRVITYIRWTFIKP